MVVLRVDRRGSRRWLGLVRKLKPVMPLTGPLIEVRTDVWADSLTLHWYTRLRCLREHVLQIYGFVEWIFEHILCIDLITGQRPRAYKAIKVKLRLKEAAMISYC